MPMKASLPFKVREEFLFPKIVNLLPNANLQDEFSNVLVITGQAGVGKSVSGHAFILNDCS